MYSDSSGVSVSHTFCVLCKNSRITIFSQGVFLYAEEVNVMQRISEVILNGGQRIVAGVNGVNLRAAGIAALIIIAAFAVFFSYRAQLMSSVATPLPADIEQSVKRESVRELSNTNQEVTRTDAPNKNQNSAKTHIRSSNTNSHVETTVEVDGSTTKLKNNQTFNKTIRTKDGSALMKIHASSNSRGNSDSSLNVEIDYSTNLDKEVEHSATTQ